MAAGIFFFDRFLPEVSVSLVYSIFLPLVFFAVVAILVNPRSYLRSILFGIVASFCFFLIGGILLLYERRSIEYDWNNKECMYYGHVLSSPEVKGRTLCSLVHVSGEVNYSDSLSVTPIDRDIMLYWSKDSVSTPMRCGDKVFFRSIVSKPVSDVEFMGFDYSKYLLTKGVSGTSFVFPSNMVFEEEDDVSLKVLALRCRDLILEKYSEWGLDDENLAVVSALTIGDKSELTPEIKEIYSTAGTSHVLALSGLHVGILSGILYLLLWPLKKIRYGKLLQSAAVVAVLWIFAFVSGLSPSVVRAVTMCTLYLLASSIVENGLSGMYSLTLAAFVMLCFRPLYLFDISFQLSFLAVLSIIMFFPFFNSLLKTRNVVLKYLWGMMSISVSAQLGTLPLILYYFGNFPTYFLLANLIVSPLAVCILSFAMASLLLMGIPYVGNSCICVLDIATGMLNGSMRYVGSLHGASITSINVNELQMVLMFLVIVCLYLLIHVKSSSVIIAMIFFSCLFVGAEYYKAVKREAPSVFLAWSDVYLKDGRKRKQLASCNGIYSVSSINIGVMKDGFWRNKELKPGECAVSLDYVYFCRGFRGDIKSLSGIFVMKKVILDPSLSQYYRELIKKQCAELDIPYYEISGQASYRIIL